MLKNWLVRLIILLSSPAFALQLVPESLSTPARHKNLMIFTRRTDDKVIAIDRTTKKIKWIWSAKGYNVRVQPAVKEGVAYVWASGITGSKACAINCDTGKTVWETSLTGYTFSSGVLVGDVVLFSVADEDDILYALGQKSGYLLWQNPYDLKFVHKEILGVTGKHKTRLLLIDAASGKASATFKISEEEWISPRIAVNHNGTAIVAFGGCLSSRGKWGIFAVDVNNKKELWRREGDEHVKYSPEWIGEILYMVVSSNSTEKNGIRIERVSFKTGKPESSFKFPEIKHEYIDVASHNEVTPFVGGVAKVHLGGVSHMHDDGTSEWNGGEWLLIDTRGNVLKRNLEDEENE